MAGVRRRLLDLAQTFLANPAERRQMAEGGAALEVIDRVKRMTAGPYDTNAVMGEDDRMVTQSVEQLFALMRQSGGSFGGLSTQLSDEEARQHLHRWQFAATMAIAEAVMMTPWVVEVMKAGKWQAADLDHPLNMLLNHVNPFMTLEELKLYTTADALVLGKSWWAIVDNSLGEPAEIIPLIGKVVPVPDPKTFIKHWTQTYIGKGGRHFEKIWQPEEIVYFRFPSPGDLYGGKGPMQAAGSAVRLDEQIIESEWAAFKQGIFPFAIMTMAAKTASKRRELLDEFNEVYSGAQNTGRTIGLGPNQKVDFPSTKPREMGYHQGAQDVQEQILGIWRTPAAMLGLSRDVNRASAEGMEYVFSKWRITPILTLFVARANQDLVRPRFGDDTRLTFTSPVPADRQVDMQEEDQDLRHGVRTINEVREKRGLEPKEWGDKPAGQAPPSPVGEGGKPPTSPPAKRQRQAVVGGDGVSLSSIPPGIGEPPAKRTNADVRHVMARHEDHRLAIQDVLTKRVARFFRTLTRDVVSAWHDDGDKFSLGEPTENGHVTLILPSSVERALDPQAVSQQMADALRPSVRRGVFIGAQFERETAGGVRAAKRELDVAVDRYVSEYNSSHYLGVAEETRSKAMRIVQQGIEKEETQAQIEARLRRNFGDMSEGRARVIAETETTRLYGAGAQAFRESAGIEWKQWVCSFVRSRVTHISAHGQTVRTDGMFNVGEDRMMFPGDGQLAGENCNCHCLAVSVTKR